MKGELKKALTLLIIFVMAFTLFGCASKPATPSTANTPSAATSASAAPSASAPASAAAAKTIKCYLVSPLIGGSAWGNCQKGFEKAAAALGWEYHYLGPVTTANTAEMVELAETAVSNGANIIIGNWNDKEAFNAVVDRAREKGITLLGINYSLEKRCENYLGIDPVELGKVQAETLCKNFPESKGTINVVYMQPRLSSQAHNKNYEAFCAKLKELRPTAVVISQEESNSNTQEAYDKLSAILLAHPETNAFVADCSMAAVGAATLVEERKIADKFYLQGIDGGSEILTYVKSGDCDCTIIQDWFNVGTKAVEVAKALYEGKTVDKFTGLGAYPLYKDGVDKYATENGVKLS